MNSDHPHALAVDSFPKYYYLLPSEKGYLCTTAPLASGDYVVYSHEDGDGKFEERSRVVSHIEHVETVLTKVHPPGTRLLSAKVVFEEK